MQLQHGCEGGGSGMLRDALAPLRSHTHTFFTTGFQYSFLLVLLLNLMPRMTRHERRRNARLLEREGERACWE